MTYRVRNIAIAVALAVVAALLTTFYVTNYKKSVQSGEESVTVFVAARDIPTGTSGSDVVDRKWIRSEEINRRNVVPGAISDPTQIEELSAAQPLFAGEQVSTSRFRPLEEQGLRAQLKGNVRALQVPGDEHQLLVGVLKSGDRVDVVGTWEFPEGTQIHVSRVVLRDLLVLRAANEGKVQSKLASGANLPFSAILAVTDRQAHKLFWLAQNGDWTLQLRGVADAADSPESVDTSASLLQEGLNKTQFKKGMAQIKRSSRR
jgi:Flp pilus assembly protein CpaB